jgi:hypothetical protein
MVNLLYLRSKVKKEPNHKIPGPHRRGSAFYGTWQIARNLFVFLFLL